MFVKFYKIMIIIEIVNKKMRTYSILDFAIQANHRIKLKESKKRNKYQDLARELKKLWNLKVMMISIATGALSMVTNGLIQGWRTWK